MEKLFNFTTWLLTITSKMFGASSVIINVLSYIIISPLIIGILALINISKIKEHDDRKVLYALLILNIILGIVICSSIC